MVLLRKESEEYSEYPSASRESDVYSVISAGISLAFISNFSARVHFFPMPPIRPSCIRYSRPATADSSTKDRPCAVQVTSDRLTDAVVVQHDIARTALVIRGRAEGVRVRNQVGDHGVLSRHAK